MLIVLEVKRCPEHSKMTNSLNGGVRMSDWEFETMKRGNLIGSSLDRKAWKLEKKPDMIDRLISIDGSQDIGFEINCGFNASEKADEKSSFTTLESFEQSKLSSMNLNSIKTRSFDTVKMPGSLFDTPDAKKSSSTTAMNHFNTILPRLGQFDALYFNKTNIIDFLRH